MATTYKRALLYLASRAPAKAKRRAIADSANVRFAAYLFRKSPSEVADDILRSTKKGPPEDGPKFDTLGGTTPNISERIQLSRSLADLST